MTARGLICTISFVGLIVLDFFFIHGRLTGVLIFLVAVVGFLLLAGSKRRR